MFEVASPNWNLKHIECNEGDWKEKQKQLNLESFLLSCRGISEFRKEHIIDHKFHKPEYAFHLDNAGNAIAGFVDSGVKEGSKVLVNPAQGHLSLEEGEVVKYLQVKVRSGNFTGDEDYVLENTNAFKVDENGYIIVNNTEKFNHFGVFEFYVVMFRLADIVLGSSTVYCWGHLNIKPFIFYLKSKYVFFNEIHFDLNFKY
ncbi:Hypothetical predicted protein [Mytilus galloprovincialis]|uniref:Uncharacterized protein n=1 Tax=Mytilus galloprovincialis TaxID=29158 RepID=A0A8B6CPE3_MYTGA|nr:Hypothetical predicted protein [Mytilus galloprovincialis]